MSKELHAGIVALDRTPVSVQSDELHPVWWRGKQWAVTTIGIEALDGTYICDANRLTEGMQDHAWPEHMADKVWVDAGEFATAWMVALVMHGYADPADAPRVRAICAKLPD